jgi:hypothetical protein
MKKIHPIQIVNLESRKGEWELTSKIIDSDGRYETVTDRIRAPHDATPTQLRVAVRKLIGPYKAGAPIYFSEARGQFKIGNL